MLVSRAANVIHIPRETEHALKQLRAAVHIAREFVREVIDPDLAAARKLNEELFRVATSSDAMKVWTKFAIDLFEAVLCDPAFGSEFMTTRYPQMRDQIERRRQRRKR